MNKSLESYKEINELDFWYYYLRLVNINSPYLSDREMDLFGYLLSLEYGKPLFEWGDLPKYSKALNISKQHVYELKKSLIAKEYLIDDEFISISKNFTPFQNYVKRKGDVITFTFPYKLTK